MPNCRRWVGVSLPSPSSRETCNNGGIIPHPRDVRRTQSCVPCDHTQTCANGALPFRRKDSVVLHDVCIEPILCTVAHNTEENPLAGIWWRMIYCARLLTGDSSTDPPTHPRHIDPQAQDRSAGHAAAHPATPPDRYHSRALSCAPHRRPECVLTFTLLPP